MRMFAEAFTVMAPPPLVIKSCKISFIILSFGTPENIEGCVGEGVRVALPPLGGFQPCEGRLVRPNLLISGDRTTSGPTGKGVPLECPSST
jgi:hypothetical protein